MGLSSVLRTPSVARVPHRSLLSVFGSQASEFLNGVLATSMREPRSPGFSTVLTAKGRVLYDIFIYTQKDDKGKPGYLIEFDGRPNETPLLDLLKRYVLRSKVKIRDVSAEYDVWAAWGASQVHWETERTWRWAGSGAVEPVWSGGEWPWGIEDGVIRDRRAVGMGKRMAIRKGDTPLESHDHDQVDSYNLHRMLRGVPEGQLDIPPGQALPMDCNLDMMGGLDFRKGCYVGQELTVRTYHTGVLRKRIYPVTITKQGDPKSAERPSASQITSPSGRKRTLGTILTSQDRYGLALLRMENVDAGLPLQVKTTVGVEGGEPDSSIWDVKPIRPDWWPEPRTQSAANGGPSSDDVD